MRRTALICCVVMITLGIYDGVAASIGLPTTISRWFYETGINAPLFIFQFGFIAGHVFGYMTPTITSALLPRKSLPDGYTIKVLADKKSIDVELYNPDGEIIMIQTEINSDIVAMVKFANDYKKGLVKV